MMKYEMKEGEASPPFFTGVNLTLFQNAFYVRLSKQI